MDNNQSIKDAFQQILENQIKFLKATSDIQRYTLQQLAEIVSSDSSNPFQEGIKDKDKNEEVQAEFSLFDYYSITRRDDVLISYKGPVTDIILSEISKDIRDKFGSNPNISKKLFAVFIELAQNILYYSSEKIHFADKKDSIGTLLITKMPDHFTFSCGNLVENKFIEELIVGCEKINSLNREELREFKRATRSGPKKDRSKGAGIGLIQVALTSGNPLSVESRKVDDSFSFFSLSVKIDSEQKETDEK
jgi:hypothetical protein